MALRLSSGQARQLQRLMADWDNNLPGWKDFLRASERRTVRVTKNCYIPPSLYPGQFRRDIMLFGLLTPGAGILTALGGFGYCLFFGASWWWAAGGLALGIYLLSVATNGCAQTAFLAAMKESYFYHFAVARGVFYFPPDPELTVRRDEGQPG
jgi:hypothetical protein